MSSRQLLIVAVVGLFVSAAHADTIYVDDDAPLSGNGQTWDTAFQYLQDALYEAAGDPSITEIRVAQGTYKADQDEAGNVTPGDRDVSFDIPGAVALRGGYAGIGTPDPNERDIELHETVLSGDLLGDDEPGFVNYADNSRHVVTVIEDGGLASLDGFTIRGGNADDEVPYPGNSGGGIHIESGSPVISDCTMIENTARTGGGLSLLLGSPTIERCVFSANVATHTAGAARLDPQGEPQLIDCVFSANVSEVLWGGAIEVLSSTPTLTRCSFLGNVAAWGGAIRCRASTILEDCEFIDNSGLQGAGGAVAASGGTTVATGCTFTDNFSVYHGGAVSCVSGHFIASDTLFERNHAGDDGGGFSSSYVSRNTLVNCTFIDNVAEGPHGGGGVHHESKQLTVVNCSFRGNTSVNAHGGAIGLDTLAFIYGTRIQNCVIHGNSAALFGGGVYIQSRYELEVSNCTIVANASGSGGGGVYLAEAPPTIYGLPRIDNSIIRGNEPGQIDSSVDSPPYPVRYCNVQGGYPGTGNIDADPLFVDPASGDQRLSPGSPCIDAGDNTAVPEGITTDLDGNPRFVDDPDTDDTGYGDPPIVDMGAYEFQGTPCPWDLDGDGNVFVTDLLMLLASWGHCDGCPADFNDDGLVNVMDLLALIANFGPCPGSLCVWDVNGDGIVDQADLHLVLDNFGPCDGCPEDVNGDGVVNGQDAAAVARHFGPCP